MGLATERCEFQDRVGVRSYIHLDPSMYILYIGIHEMRTTFLKKENLEHEKGSVGVNDAMPPKKTNKKHGHKSQFMEASLLHD